MREKCNTLIIYVFICGSLSTKECYLQFLGFAISFGHGYFMGFCDVIQRVYDGHGIERSIQTANNIHHNIVATIYAKTTLYLVLTTTYIHNKLGIHPKMYKIANMVFYSMFY